MVVVPGGASSVEGLGGKRTFSKCRSCSNTDQSNIVSQELKMCGMGEKEGTTQDRTTAAEGIKTYILSFLLLQQAGNTSSF
jgi:hypothetical protein